LLDEPTNHLDIPAREALQQVLEDFSGTILLVSHDRYLIDRLATQIWEIQAGKLTIFKGGYRDYILRMANGPAAATGLKSTRLKGIILADKPVLHGNGREVRRKAELITQMEGRIHAKEEEVQHLSLEIEKVAGFSGRNDRLQDLSRALAQAQAELDNLMTEWEKAAA
jgi:ATP-binding cassette subfamily F protein 3